MTAEEAINEITSEPKYYIGIINQSTASETVKRFKEGRITLNTLKAFLGKFGYVKRGNEWIKTKVETPHLKFK